VVAWLQRQIKSLPVNEILVISRRDFNIYSCRIAQVGVPAFKNNHSKVLLVFVKFCGIRWKFKLQDKGLASFLLFCKPYIVIVGVKQTIRIDLFFIWKYLNCVFNFKLLKLRYALLIRRGKDILLSASCFNFIVASLDITCDLNAHFYLNSNIY